MTCLIRLPSPMLGAAAALLVLAVARAQCTAQWAPGYGVPGVDAPVTALATWDPDGAGPAPSAVVVGGSFRLAGATSASAIARYDPGAGIWSALGAGLTSHGMPGTVRALAVLADGSLVAGGDFTHAGTTPTANIARWDGAAWTPLGAGVNGSVRALAVLPNGDLVAGGTFLAAGGVAANRIARWDGAVWAPVGAPTAIGGASVEALAVLPGGDLVAGGNFASADGASVQHVARWDGIAWAPLGAGMDSVVYCLRTLANGDLVAGGLFTAAGGTAAARIARWNGTAWAPLGAGVGGMAFAQVACLAELPTGELLAGGGFTTAGGGGAAHVARWDSPSLAASWRRASRAGPRRAGRQRRPAPAAMCWRSRPRRAAT